MAPPPAPLLRILLVCEDLPSANPGGLARHVINLGNALIDAGHQVDLLMAASPADPALRAATGFAGRVIPDLPGNPGWSELRLGFFNPWKRPWVARRFARVIVRHAAGYDVVHYHGHFPLLAAWLPATLNFVQTRHDQGSECITHLRLREGQPCAALDPRVCARCAHPRPGPLRTALSAAAVRRWRALTEQAFRRHPVIYVSEMLRRNYRRAVPEADERRVQVIRHFLREDQLFAAAARPLPRPPGAAVVVHVAGRLDAAKGIAALLAQLAPRLPADWVVRVLGDGPERTVIEARHGADARIQMLGARAQDEVFAALAGADVAVVPSLWEEPFGAVTVEALRLGKPCYALARGGTLELGRFGAPGQLRLFDDLAALVEALVTAPAFATLRGGESVDVGAVLPAILAVYRHGLQPGRQAGRH